MSLQKVLVPIRKHDVEFLKLFFKEHFYRVETVLFYKDHVPGLAYLLTEGSLVIKRNRNIIEAPQLSLIGIREAFSKTPASYQATATPGAKILGINLYTLGQFLSQNPQFYDVFQLETL